MKLWLLIGVVAIPVGWLGVADGRGRVLRTVRVGGQTVVVREATPVSLPPVPGSSVGFDCNNALFWSGGTLYAFSSHEHPYRSAGPDLAGLAATGTPTRVHFDNEQGWANGGRWIESVHKATDGRLYMWYHHEPRHVFEGYIVGLTAPKIGQMVSDDDGLTWRDQGPILEAPRDALVDSVSANKFFGGGHGDFSAIADHEGRYLYFFLSSYDRDPARQGVTLARLPIADLDAPSGKATFWCDGAWTEPGLGGKADPIFPAERDWHSEGASAYWGPSVHWNTALKKYVLLLNRTKDGNWTQDGIHVAVGDRLDDPSSWSAPARLIESDDWYPQVIGTSRGARETDRRADRLARLFIKGRSSWTIEFLPPGG